MISRADLDARYKTVQRRVLIEFEVPYSKYRDAVKLPVKIVYPHHVEIVGTGHVLLMAPHVTSTEEDLHTGPIVEEAALTSRSFAVIGKVSREFTDTDTIQAARTDLRKSVEGYITEDEVKYLLQVQGTNEQGIDVTTAPAQTCSDSTIEIVRSRLASNFEVRTTKELSELALHGTLADLSRKDGQGKFIVETICIGFGPDERQFQKEVLIRNLSEIVDILNGRVVSGGD
jgi:virulence-associated protein VagC